MAEVEDGKMAEVERAKTQHLQRRANKRVLGARASSAWPVLAFLDTQTMHSMLQERMRRGGRASLHQLGVEESFHPSAQSPIQCFLLINRSLTRMCVSITLPVPVPLPLPLPSGRCMMFQGAFRGEV